MTIHLQTIWMIQRILTTTTSKIAVIITAAGSSTRIGGGIKKEYLPLKNGTVISSCAKTFLTSIYNNYSLSDFIITCPAGAKEQCKLALDKDEELQKLLYNFWHDYGLKPQIVEGSSTRQKSVFNGLAAVKNNPDIVLIHDGARPFVTNKIILDTIKAAIEFGAAVPGVTPTDTQKEIDENGMIIRHLQRSHLSSVQTPQGFDFSRLFDAHKSAQKDGQEYTDDTEIWGHYVGSVKIVAGDVNNIKITYPEDLKKL